ncbi:hypothetical protein GQ457_01G000080 [Hibiscus cannabinus]
MHPLSLGEHFTWNASHEAEKNQSHIKECMIQRLCENSMVRFGQKEFLKKKKKMPNDGTNLLEVPGNRLLETGSRQMKILHIRGAW